MAYTGQNDRFEEGTEFKTEDDDTAYIQEALKKRLKLNSGKEVLYISYAPPKQGKTKRRIVCHVCYICKMYTASDLKKHLTGSCHNENLQSDLSRSKFKKPFRLIHSYSHDGKHPITFQIYPGEDIPWISPYFERRLECKSWGETQRIQKKQLNSLKYNEPAVLFNEKYPLLGLEYIIVMLKKHKTVIYCALCKTKYLNDKIYEHVVSIKHERNYILKHFPTLYGKVVSRLKIPDEKTKERLVHYIFRKLYQRCERKHGRRRIQSANLEAFEDRPHDFIQPILAQTHYGENTLSEVTTENLLLNLIEKCHENKNALGHYPAFIPPPSVESISYPAQKEAFWKEYKHIRNKALPQWTIYSDMKEEKMNELRAKYEKYDNQPESHPNYENEWKKYYTKKYQMLEEEGTPISEYDFEKNWYSYWIEYLEECYAIESRKTQTYLRNQLGLPVRTPTPNASQDFSFINPVNEGPVEINDSGSKYGVPDENIADCLDEESNLWKEQNFVSPEKIDEDHRHENPLALDQNFAPQTRKNPDQLLPVLRVLSALEHRLGSLGPKCMELLEETLRKERTMQVEEMLANQENFIFFETVNLKLKGLLSIKSFADDAIETIRNLTDDIDDLLSVMEREINRNSKGNTSIWSAENTKTSNAEVYIKDQCYSSVNRDFARSSNRSSQEQAKSISSNLQRSNGNQNYHGRNTKQSSVGAAYSAPVNKSSQIFNVNQDLSRNNSFRDNLMDRKSDNTQRVKESMQNRNFHECDFSSSFAGQKDSHNPQEEIINHKTPKRYKWYRSDAVKTATAKQIEYYKELKNNESSKIPVEDVKIRFNTKWDEQYNKKINFLSKIRGGLNSKSSGTEDPNNLGLPQENDGLQTSNVIFSKTFGGMKRKANESMEENYPSIMHGGLNSKLNEPRKDCYSIPDSKNSSFNYPHGIHNWSSIDRLVPIDTDGEIFHRSESVQSQQNSHSHDYWSIHD